MAPKGQKRSAQENKKGGDAKKGRADPTTVAIEEVIKNAELPSSCREMLLTCISPSLETPRNKRHEIQSSMVKMVEELICAREGALNEKTDTAKRLECEAEVAQTDLVSKLSAAEAVLSDKNKVVEDRFSALSAANKKVESAKESLSATQEAQRAGDATYQQTQETKAALQKALEKDLIDMKEGVAGCAELVPLLKQTSFDESLVIALPGTCAKAAADRGPFDSMVLTQLENSLKDKLAELSKVVEAEAPSVQERAATVAATEKVLADATKESETAASQHVASESDRAEAASAFARTQSELKAFEPQVHKAVAAREKATVALENFQCGTRAPFEVLRDATLMAESPAKTADSDGSVPVTVGGA